MAITMREIAKRASVSHTTASLILKGGKASERFSKETIKRVHRIAAETGYRPNRTAAILRNQKNCLIGVLSGGYRMESFGSMLEGVSNVVEPKYGIVPTVHHFSGKKESDSLQMFVDMRVSGIIAFWSGEEKNIPLYRDLVEKYDIPVVLCDSAIPTLEVPYLIANDEKLAYLASSTLLGLGHRKILGLIFQQPDNPKAKSFITGYRRAMSEYEESNIDFITSMFDANPFRTEEYTRLISVYVDRVIKHLKQNNFKYTAIWAQDDLIAFDLMLRLDKLGLKVPDDISLIGMGNYEVSDMPQISLSSVASRSFVDNGSILSNALLDIINGKKPSSTRLERNFKVFLRNSIRKLES